MLKTDLELAKENISSLLSLVDARDSEIEQLKRLNVGLVAREFKQAQLIEDQQILLARVAAALSDELRNKDAPR